MKFLKEDTLAKEMVTLSELEEDKTRIPPFSWSGFHMRNSHLLVNFRVSEFDSENTYACDLCL